MASKLEGLTVKGLIDFRQSFFDRYDPIQHDRIRLAKLFLAELLDLPKTTPTEEIAAEFRKSKSGSNLPASDTEFWDQIAKTYLGYKLEPRDEIIKLSLNASDDLKNIAQQLSYIESEKAQLEKKKAVDGRLSAEDRYYRNQLEYYKKKNQIAREQIVDFITNRMRSKALISASDSVLNGISSLGFFNRPYPYSAKPFWGHTSRYDVRGLDELSNKFMDLPAGSYDDIAELYKTSPDEFYEFAETYIAGIPGNYPSVREKILAHASKSHVLDRRKRIIETMLNHYDNRDYLSFVSIAPLQVEGIFADLCRELGVTEGQLDISSLNDKLGHIDERLKSFLFYEYYSFKFPVLRNFVAHGELVDGDLARTSILLMLDFLPVCDLATSEELPVNHKIKLMDEILSTKKQEKLLEWIDVHTVQVPIFYGRSNDILKIEAMFESDDFWNFMTEKLESDERGKESMAIKYAGKIKSAGISEARCVKFLSSSKETILRGEEKRAERQSRLAKLLKPANENQPPIVGD